MTSNRAYRDAMPSRVARLRLAQAVESQFDTSASQLSRRPCWRAEDYRTATRADFEPNYTDDAEMLERCADRRKARRTSRTTPAGRRLIAGSVATTPSGC